MKRMKKFLALLLALVMALGLMTTALASEVASDAGSSTSKSTADPNKWFLKDWGDTTGHTFKAYQIFSGTQVGNSPSGVRHPLSDIEWGTGINATEFLTALKNDSRFVVGDTNIYADCKTAADVAYVLSEEDEEKNPESARRAFGLLAANYVVEAKGQVIEPKKDDDVDYDRVTLNAGNGYYLFVDTTSMVDAEGKKINDALNPALLQVTNQGVLYIQKKYDIPTVDKSVLENRDNTWGEAADYNIGDTVPFRLVGTLPTNLDDYTAYYYSFRDTLNWAFTADQNSVKVYLVNGDVDISAVQNWSSSLPDGVTAIASDKVAVELINSDGTVNTYGSLNITFSDIKSVSDVTKDSRIVVFYTAVLNSSAKIGTDQENKGNPNDVRLHYSNDPSWTGTGDSPTSATPLDRVQVYTYELDITKVDGSNTDTKLEGAEFKLYKGGDNDELYAKVDANNKVTGWTSTESDASALTTDADGLVKIIGLDAGTYYLKETAAPAGYNTIDTITVVISSTLDATEETGPALTALSIAVGSNDATDGVLGTGVVSMTVENLKGATLPETGGIGTTLFYVIGGVLVAGAAVVLITRKRVRDEQ